ncbi:hypothetical protein TIFTF001_053108, partial [Ficus carica]
MAGYLQALVNKFCLGE